MRKKSARKLAKKSPVKKVRAEESLVGKSLAEGVRRWFECSVTYEGEAYVIDAEQAEAVVSDHYNTIVVARAGSGKTRTIVAKIVYLIAKCGVRPKEILVFVFNANAAREINERLAKMKVDGEPIVSKSARVAATFHAFARKIVYEACGGKEKCGEILVEERRAFIERIVRGIIKDGIDEMEMKRKVGQIETFVNRAQQQFLGGEGSLMESVDARLAEEIDDEERGFLQLGREVYRRYHWYLLNARGSLPGFENYGTDFNLIVSWASGLIKARRGAVVELLAGVRYIMVDEYQDFSQLFLAAVVAVRSVASGARLFVVGDDWQAINRFAGSEVRYFKEFERYFSEDVKRLEITTNYRCDRLIVATARKFMRKAMSEEGEFWAFSRRIGRVVLVDAKRTKGRYLEILVQLVKENRKAEEILLLHRNNETNLKIGLVGLVRALKREVVRLGVMSGADFDAKVRTMTMHKSKGLEAEVVIILEADEGVLPKVHPDTRLYTVFGETDDVALDDQKRLFYVAMTRAKRRLYIMHEIGDTKKVTGFVKYLGRGVERWEE